MESLTPGNMPTAMALLPDGRIILRSEAWVLRGDGVRWEFARIASNAIGATSALKVAGDGHVYINHNGHFGRIIESSGEVESILPLADVPQDNVTVGSSPGGVLELEDTWLWFGGSGSLVAWKPGQSPVVIRHTAGTYCLMHIGRDVFVSDRATGKLFRVNWEKRCTEDFSPIGMRPENGIIAACAFNEGHLLVALSGGGLKVFDGRELKPFNAVSNEIDSGYITDICPTGGGTYAAAIIGLGVVCFDEHGRITLAVDRSVDQRVSRPARLLMGRKGVLWVLLNEGLLRVSLDSRISDFSKLVPANLSYAKLLRHDGALWIESGGKIMRGQYSMTGRLLRFEEESPPKLRLGNGVSMGGRLFGSNGDGLYEHFEHRWNLIDTRAAHARVGLGGRTNNGWLFARQGEVGWVKITELGLSMHGQAAPELGEIYNSVNDGAGRVWLELGSGKAAMIETRSDFKIDLRVFTPADGLTEKWTEIFVVDGTANFNLTASKAPAPNIVPGVYTVDPLTGALSENKLFTHLYPEVHSFIGRPLQDHRGRIWFTMQGAVHMLDPSLPMGRRVKLVHPSFAAVDFCGQTDGTVWMSRPGQLLRVDGGEAPPTTMAPIPMLTSVEFPTTGRREKITTGNKLKVGFGDNSVTIRFAIPDAHPGMPVTFEMCVDESHKTDAWRQLGNAGFIALNKLMEGDYVIRVRTRMGLAVSDASTFEFTVLPPWYRSTAARISMFAAIPVLIAMAVGIVRFLDLRETRRLAILVEQRTRQLQSQVDETVRQSRELERSREEYRQLNAQLETRVSERTKALAQAGDQLAEANKELEAFSFSVSHDLKAPLRNIQGFHELLVQLLQSKGITGLERFLQPIGDEARRMGRLIDDLLNLSRVTRADMKTEAVSLNELIAEFQDRCGQTTEDRVVEWHVSTLPLVNGDKGLLAQVVENLLGNAIKFTRGKSPAIIDITAEPIEADGMIRITVRDNGAGFDATRASKLFGAFQRLHSQKEFEGTGVGLANVKRIIARHGGKIWAEGSPGHGASFHFTLPHAE